LKVTRIGHACQLIQIGEIRVETDPWFTQTATYYHGEPIAATVQTLPHRYAFHSGWLGDRMITKGDRDPRHYADVVARIAPGIDVRLALPGTTVTVP
jgi:hypothetical protein